MIAASHRVDEREFTIGPLKACPRMALIFIHVKMEFELTAKEIVAEHGENAQSYVIMLIEQALESGDDVLAIELDKILQIIELKRFIKY